MPPGLVSFLAHLSYTKHLDWFLFVDMTSRFEVRASDWRRIGGKSAKFRGFLRQILSAWVNFFRR